MGTASTKKFVKQLGGNLVEEAALTTSVGSADANKIVALGDDGRLDASMMPTGIGADVQIIPASEALTAGDFVNIWSDAGSFKVRRADATVTGKQAHGFVLASVASGANATVYFEGNNTQVTGQVPGNCFLQAGAAGQAGAVAPSAPGQVTQIVGFATSTTSINVQIHQPILLA